MADLAPPPPATDRDIDRWLGTFNHSLQGGLAAGQDPATAATKAKSLADRVHGVLPPGTLAGL